MHEIVPVAIGAVLALACETAPGRVARRIAWVAASVLGGTAATVLTGESAVSWAFVLIDIPLAALAAAVTRRAVLAAARRHRAGILRPYVREKPST